TADGLDASGDANIHRGLKLFSGFRRVLGDNLRYSVTRVEPLAVRLVPQSLDLADAAQTLLQQIIFEGQTYLLGEIGYYNRSLLLPTAEPLLQRSISIVIPAYNEEKRLPSTLERIVAFVDRKNFAFTEILVVDDGSRDRTVVIASEFALRRRCIRVLENPGNRGKGYAVRHGMLESKGEWALFTDADLSTPIEELEKRMSWAERQ